MRPSYPRSHGLARPVTSGPLRRFPWPSLGSHLPRQQGGAMSVTAERPLALVTDASTGIGFELAKVFAENGFDLIVAAENDEIREAGTELRRAGAQVDAVQVDLATEAGVQELERHVREAQRPLEA